MMCNTCGHAHLRDLEPPNSAKCNLCGVQRAGHGSETHIFYDPRSEGAELQRGLEVAVERERERLDGPDIVAHLDNSDTTVHEGARNECPACEDEGHVGQSDDF